jgi:hypothetical protein
MKTRRRLRRKGGVLGRLVRNPNVVGTLASSSNQGLSRVEEGIEPTYDINPLPSKVSTPESSGWSGSTALNPAYGSQGYLSTGAEDLGQWDPSSKRDTSPWGGRTRRRKRRGGGRLATTATVLALLPMVANGESLWSTLLSGKRLTDDEVQQAATAIVTKANQMQIPLPPSPIEVVAHVLDHWTPPASPSATPLPEVSIPSSIAPDGLPVDTASWVPSTKYYVDSVNPGDGDTGFETTPVTIVSDDGRMVYVKASDDDLEYPFPKDQIKLRPVSGGRRRRTVRRRKTLRRKR